jgi:predicted acetyltransferase
MEGALVGRLGIVSRLVSAGEQVLRVGGIAGVVALPELRGRGVASALLRQAAIFMREEVCVPSGCEKCVGPGTVTQPLLS